MNKPRDPGIAVLRALAGGVLGEDPGAKLPARILATVDALASRRDRDQLATALRLLARPAGALALTGRPTPVPGMAPAAAEALLQRWQRSRVPVRRQLAAAILAATLSAHYGVPGAAWERIGY